MHLRSYGIHGGLLASWICACFCYIPVETVNETVAALYNITDFPPGECCWLIPVQLLQCEPKPAFLLPGLTIPPHTPLTWPEPVHLWPYPHRRLQTFIIVVDVWKIRLYALEHHNNQYIKAHNCPNNPQSTFFSVMKRYLYGLLLDTCEPGGGCFWPGTSVLL